MHHRALLGAARLASAVVVVVLAAPAAAQDATGTRPAGERDMGAAAPPASQPATTAPAGPAASEVLRRAVEAMGGREAIDRITSTHMIAEFSSPMAPGPMEADLRWGRPGKVLIQRRMAGMELTTGSDGTVGWVRDPAEGTYALLSPAETESLRGDANMQFMLLELEALAADLPPAEIAEFQGRRSFRIKMTGDPRGPEKGFAHFDAESGLMTGIEYDERGPLGEPMPVTIAFSDWQPAEGVKFFRRVVMKQADMTANLTFRKIEVNTTDPALFALPEEVARLAAARRAAPPTTAPAEPADGHDGAGKSSKSGLARILDRVEKMEDPEQVRMLLGVLEAQGGQVSADDRAEYDALVKRLRERLSELEKPKTGDDE